MADILTLTLTVESRGPAGAFALSDEQAAAAGDGAAKAAYEGLAPSHRREFARWIAEAKREATRAQRVTKTLEMLRAGEHR